MNSGYFMDFNKNYYCSTSRNKIKQLFKWISLNYTNHEQNLPDLFISSSDYSFSDCFILFSTIIINSDASISSALAN